MLVLETCFIRTMYKLTCENAPIDSFHAVINNTTTDLLVHFSGHDRSIEDLVVSVRTLDSARLLVVHLIAHLTYRTLFRITLVDFLLPLTHLSVVHGSHTNAHAYSFSFGFLLHLEIRMFDSFNTLPYLTLNIGWILIELSRVK